MEKLDIYVTKFIISYLNPNDTLIITTINTHFRYILNIRKDMIMRFLIHKVYQEGIRDGFGLFLDNIGLGNIPDNNINGFLLGDTLNVTDPWYSSIQRVNDNINKVSIIGNRYQNK